MQLIFTFESTRKVLSAQQAFDKNQIECAIIPTPREISSNCGIAITTNMENEKRCAKALYTELITPEMVRYFDGIVYTSIHCRCSFHEKNSLKNH